MQTSRDLEGRWPKFRRYTGHPVWDQPQVKERFKTRMFRLAWISSLMGVLIIALIWIGYYRLAGSPTPILTQYLYHGATTGFTLPHRHFWLDSNRPWVELNSRGLLKPIRLA